VGSVGQRGIRLHQVRSPVSQRKNLYSDLVPVRQKASTFHRAPVRRNTTIIDPSDLPQGSDFLRSTSSNKVSVPRPLSRVHRRMDWLAGDFQSPRQLPSPHIEHEGAKPDAVAEQTSSRTFPFSKIPSDHPQASRTHLGVRHNV
jgi:hypothetical protein